MVRVAAGPYLRGSLPAVGLEDERPQRKIQLDTFDIDRTELSTKRYQSCVQAGRCTEPRCIEDDDSPERRATHPVVCVTWQQAFDYCAWATKRLPTEAEWEKAARGIEGGKYPWGHGAPSCERANFAGCNKGGTHAVGALSAAKSPFGALDMAGNVWEWVGDWHHAEYYAVSPTKNPPGPWNGSKKVVCGGAFSYDKDSLESHGRTYDRPTVAYEHVGFRCASSPAF